MVSNYLKITRFGQQQSVRQPGTLNRDGSPQSERCGSITTEKTRAHPHPRAAARKLRTFARDPRVSLSLHEPETSLFVT